MSSDGLVAVVVVSEMLLLVSENRSLPGGAPYFCRCVMVVVSSSVAVQMVAEQVERNERNFMLPPAGGDRGCFEKNVLMKR